MGSREQWLDLPRRVSEPNKEVGKGLSRQWVLFTKSQRSESSKYYQLAM